MTRAPLLLAGWGVLLVGCAGPVPPLSTALPMAPVLDCSTCTRENPGDLRSCEMVCHEQPTDTGGAQPGAALH
ncbi:MAG: hypothetical protein ACREE2_19190 [Stellaceae bacterium]